MGNSIQTARIAESGQAGLLEPFNDLAVGQHVVRMVFISLLHLEANAVFVPNQAIALHPVSVQSAGVGVGLDGTAVVPPARPSFT